ncbi:MAG TPA: serine/threonine-protein kinase, partial [Thermoleophilia bacterium]|nr:serine/threonine-protein kinase [Thermoleophilia bacterium]
MTLTAGTRLGCYEIVALIGAGGMGEVYRARDTKLGRDVAIKVLASGVAADPERLARFKREAQLLASLNHANIAAIHGLEEEGGHPFLVLELVDGEDLGERLKRGAFPVEQALPIARQIAGGLEQAHRQGVVHRDLKPANIKLTRDGRVKVLDFGLAKAYSGDPTESSAPEQSHSPTLTYAGSAMGVILGTAAYMSPEQARGQAVDKRTDIWAFGCVLYDMLTGRSAFGAKTTTDTLAAVVRAEPDWAGLPPSTPAPIRTLLRRCLAKDATSRLHDIADARIEIEEALATPAVTPTTGVSDLRM